MCGSNHLFSIPSYRLYVIGEGLKQIRVYYEPYWTTLEEASKSSCFVAARKGVRKKGWTAMHSSL